LPRRALCGGRARRPGMPAPHGRARASSVPIGRPISCHRRCGLLRVPTQVGQRRT
jgi:hypothetical protein